MKRIVVAAFCLASTISIAQDADESVADDAESVDLRVSVIENIVVTAEKSPSAQIEEADEDVAAILDEVDALEDEQSPE